MESISRTPILEFNSDTLNDVRKQFDLEKPITLNENIDVIEEWLQKQEQFVKKDYPRSHLERLIIFNKGSVEKTKSKIYKLSKFRRTYPKYFEPVTREERYIYPDLVDGILPRMTPDDERVCILRNWGKKYEKGLFFYYKYLICLAQYMQVHDYNNGFILLVDYTNGDILELFKAINIMELQKVVKIVTDGYGMRLKGLHMLSKNKAIQIMVKIFNQILSTKLASRIMVHKTLDTVYDYIPKELLPIEYGGNEKSIDDIYENTLSEVTSVSFTQYLKEMSAAVDKKKNTQNDNINIDDSGIPGSFRTINID